MSNSGELRYILLAVFVHPYFFLRIDLPSKANRLAKTNGALNALLGKTCSVFTAFEFKDILIFKNA